MQIDRTAEQQNDGLDDLQDDLPDEAGAAKAKPLATILCIEPLVLYVIW